MYNQWVHSLESINLPPFDLHLLLAGVQGRRCQEGSCEHVWTFSLGRSFPLRFHLPPAAACLSWQSGWSWTPGSRKKDVPAEDGSSSAWCLLPGNSGPTTFHLRKRVGLNVIGQRKQLAVSLLLCTLTTITTTTVVSGTQKVILWIQVRINMPL